MHETIIHAHRDGSVAFTKLLDDGVAVAWPLKLTENRGLPDALAFHQAWKDGQKPPQSVKLAEGDYLLIITHPIDEWKNQQGETTVIGTVGHHTTLCHQRMSETPRRYFGFHRPDNRNNGDSQP